MEQSRKKFLKGIGMVGLSAIGITSILDACKKSSSTDDAASGACATSPIETEGPFPTRIGDPAFAASAAYVRTDIKDGQAGVPLTVKVIIKNTNANCAIVQGAFVELWHCNRQGYYSEFGPANSGGMQSSDQTAFDFLRGKQVTDSTGTATFLSVYPGWYNGRAPHMHLHIYNAAGVSKLISQIAFTEAVSNTVYTTSPAYTGQVQNVSNANDGIFRDSIAQNICDSLTGSVVAGYELVKTINVAF
jgi:protocatechuate 3,4-dioxygenase beta subunit